MAKEWIATYLIVKCLWEKRDLCAFYFEALVLLITSESRKRKNCFISLKQNLKALNLNARMLVFTDMRLMLIMNNSGLLDAGKLSVGLKGIWQLYLSTYYLYRNAFLLGVWLQEKRKEAFNTEKMNDALW